MSIAAAMPNSDIDVLIGVGGSPEGVISACALKCLQGEIQACDFRGTIPGVVSFVLSHGDVVLCRPVWWREHQMS